MKKETLIQRTLKRFGYQPIAKRSYDGAQISRMVSDWITGQTSADAEIKKDLRTLIDRCRELERNDAYMRRYLGMLEANIVGATGVTLQLKVTDPDGTYDDVANGVIEDGWRAWCNAENCTVSGRYCFRELENMAVRRPAVDGGILFRKFFTTANKFGFAIEPYEIDHIDFNYNGSLGTNQIRMGVEYTPSMAVAAYHFLTTHPGDQGIGVVSRMRQRIPANEIIHVFLPERPGQTHGTPWISSVMLPLKMLHGYSEAEIAAARMGACAGMAITTSAPDGYQGETDASGNTIQEMAPGSVYRLNPGENVVGVNPTHPNAIFPDFTKAKLREIAAGLGVSYAALGNDLESTSYSSARVGLLDERTNYMTKQNWLIEVFHRQVFNEWLKAALMNGALAFREKPLPMSKFDKFNKPEWKPRRWQWVDPLKDLQANVLAMEKGLTSRRAIIAEQGGDVEDVLKEIAADKLLEKENGLDFSAESSEQANATEETPREPDDVDPGNKVSED